MSRIGRMPIAIPAGVTVEVAENNKVTVKGPKGTLERVLPSEMDIKVEGAEVLVSCKYFECYKYVLGSDAAEADHASDIEDNCYNTENVRNTGKVNISVDAMSFRSVIVIDGSGKIAVGNNTMDYKAGDSFFVTAGEKVINLEGTGTVIVTKV